MPNLVNMYGARIKQQTLPFANAQGVQYNDVRFYAKNPNGPTHVTVSMRGLQAGEKGIIQKYVGIENIDNASATDDTQWKTCIADGIAQEIDFDTNTVRTVEGPGGYRVWFNPADGAPVGVVNVLIEKNW